MVIDKVSAIIINHKTADLVATCLEGLLTCYPTLQVLLIDNGSRDASTAYIRRMAEEHSNISAVLNQSNIVDRGKPFPVLGLGQSIYLPVFDVNDPDPAIIVPPDVIRRLLTGGNVGHGPALHQGLGFIKTPYALALDSDCQIQRGGFIEKMLGHFKDRMVYAVGRIVYLGRRGRPNVTGAPHVHESVIVLDVQKYMNLKPYVQWGVPSVLNMPDAVSKGYKLVDFPIGMQTSWVYHLFQGTRKRLHDIPHLLKHPIMPQVFLQGLRSEFLGELFSR